MKAKIFNEGKIYSTIVRNEKFCEENNLSSEIILKADEVYINHNIDRFFPFHNRTSIRKMNYKLVKELIHPDGLTKLYLLKCLNKDFYIIIGKNGAELEKEEQLELFS